MGYDDRYQSMGDGRADVLDQCQGEYITAGPQLVLDQIGVDAGVV